MVTSVGMVDCWIGCQDEVVVVAVDVGEAGGHNGIPHVLRSCQESPYLLRLEDCAIDCTSDCSTCGEGIC